MSGNEKSGFIAKVIGSKKQWKEYKARVQQLPADHRGAVEAIERYLLNFVPNDGDSTVAMLEDLADLFERAAGDGTSVRAIVGADPVEFAEEFVKNYTEGGYVTPREKTRLAEAISRVADGGAR